MELICLDNTFRKDGIEYCSKCREPLEKVVNMPLFDGTGRSEMSKVHLACKCIREEKEKIRQRLEHQERMTEIAKIKNLSLIDDRLRYATLSNYNITSDNERVHRIASNYVKNFDEMLSNSQGLLFWGDVGTGKSYTAAAIANELMEQMHSVVMTSFVKLLQIIESGKSDVIERVNRATLLVIDDFGVERNTDYALEQVYNIIDSRYRKRKPIIITSNVTINAMKSCSDIRQVRIYDRIFEMCYPVKVDGTSFRKKEAAKKFEEMKQILES